jgi:drug/metabolite transporter (DMT)-like permease
VLACCTVALPMLVLAAAAIIGSHFFRAPVSLPICLSFAGLLVIAINASGHLPGKDFAGIGVSAYGAISVVLAMIFLKEKVSPGQWVGLGLIVGSVATLSVAQG